MSTQPLPSHEGLTLEAGAIDPFLAVFGGTVVRAGNPEYDAARRIWNASIDRRHGPLPER